jgi:hypothetical protein
LVETCFINLVKFDQNNFMDFIITYEADLQRKSSDPYGTAQTLLQTGNYAVTWTDLNTCLTGATGNAYEHQMALWTATTHHQYTPWITLEGAHSDSEQNACTASTLQCTCAKYTGTNSCCSKYTGLPDDVCWRI